MNPFDLTGHRVVVTGSTMGIGRGIAEAMLQAGARVVVNSHEDPHDDVLDVYASMGECHFVKSNVATVEGAQGLVEKAHEILGGLDCLANNAGTCIGRPFIEYTPEEYDTMMNLNVRGYFFATQAFAKIVGKRDHDASVICTGSTNGLQAEKGIAIYDMTKGAVLMMVRSLALELADLGIRMNGIAPGLIKTPLQAEFLKDKPDLQRVWDAQIPLGRMGQLDDVGTVAVFLASRAAKYIIGHMLYVDGGIVAQQTVLDIPGI